MTVDLIYGDAYSVVPPADTSTLIVDPPWDDTDAWALATDLAARINPISLLVFCGPAELASVVNRKGFGDPRWIFTWDTANPWRRGDTYPLQRSKFCLHYGNHYDQTAPGAQIDTGTPASAKHPGRSSSTLRALPDVYRASLRWLHNPERGDGTVQRRKTRGGHPAMRHAKPIDCVRALIAATDPTHGTIYDPFAGSGTTLIAASQLGRHAVGVEIDPETWEYASARIEHGNTRAEQTQGQGALPL